MLDFEMCLPMKGKEFEEQYLYFILPRSSTIDIRVTNKLTTYLENEIEKCGAIFRLSLDIFSYTLSPSSMDSSGEQSSFFSSFFCRTIAYAAHSKCVVFFMCSRHFFSVFSFSPQSCITDYVINPVYKETILPSF